ncbi:MAG: M23 family peptidase [Fibrobacteraceae bacterium]
MARTYFDKSSKNRLMKTVSVVFRSYSSFASFTSPQNFLMKPIHLSIILFVAVSAFAANLSNYMPFGSKGYLTSSFGESRGTRYHAGIDFSTDMEEGFPVIAPENGKIIEVRLSPFGYGKVIYFKGESGITWVFAHQSGFSKPLDSLVTAVQKRLSKNDISIENPKIPEFKTGDTLSFTGSSGIGNPHLHLEMRGDTDKLILPCRNGVVCGDTLAPLILGAAAFRKENIALTGEEALKNGCLAVPKAKKAKEPIYLVFKIADYSRTPLENPMSVRRITLKRKGKILSEIIKDTLYFSRMIQIREELLWAEEADSAGDWHYLPAKIINGDSLQLEVEDMVGNVSQREFSFADSCEGQKPSMHTANQDSALFSFLSRTWLGLNLCPVDSFTLYEKGKNKAKDLCTEFLHEPLPLAQIFEKHPKAEKIVLSRNGKQEEIPIALIGKNAGNFDWKFSFEGKTIRQTIGGLKNVPWMRALAVKRLPSDSVCAIEFHPKGLHFLKDWQIEIDRGLATAPLYYLGETSRRWFLFSKQETKNNALTTSANELRDIGFISDTTAPELGEMRLDSAYIAGKKSPVLRIPVIDKESGIPNGNAIQASDQTGKYIYAEYDSEPKEIILKISDLPTQNEPFTIKISDEAGNSRTFELRAP